MMAENNLPTPTSIKDLANPVALTLSGAMMLRHLGEMDAAARIERAIADMLAAGETTPDLGGSLGTRAFGDKLCQRIGKLV